MRKIVSHSRPWVLRSMLIELPGGLLTLFLAAQAVPRSLSFDGYMLGFLRGDLRWLHFSCPPPGLRL